MMALVSILSACSRRTALDGMQPSTLVLVRCIASTPIVPATHRSPSPQPPFAPKPLGLSILLRRVTDMGAPGTTPGEWRVVGDAIYDSDGGLVAQVSNSFDRRRRE